ncbi:8901_t:CDS:2 [Gigaspora margarita]|uniref:8901_t:CDS:1 n=1 Tax=Gigaspora margarita TaxID=4874 RepID=A0ABN7VXM6_GIGMA|nr:8901_t:CDS:2 [Gigaspora margarita]
MSEISPDKSQKTRSIINIIADDNEYTSKQKNDSNLEAKDENKEQQNNYEEEKESLTNENTKVTDVSKEKISLKTEKEVLEQYMLLFYSSKKENDI